MGDVKLAAVMGLYLGRSVAPAATTPGSARMRRRASFVKVTNALSSVVATSPFTRAVVSSPLR